MMKMPNIQFTSPEADRKVMLWISIVLMVVFWIFIAALLTVILLGALAHDVDWNLRSVAFVAFLSVTVAFLIPFQLVRYFRELRALR